MKRKKISFKYIFRYIQIFVLSIILLLIKNSFTKVSADGWGDGDGIILPPYSGEQNGEPSLPETALNNSWIMFFLSFVLVILGVITYKITSIRDKLALHLDPLVQKILCSISSNHKKRLFENRLKED
ncbi:hypothetical protein GF362_06790 [Candidatus Dojkabacteria bacterium]|nr:hypothetical protein [Candidatus Dojkabacteria bacterium]